MWTSEHLSWCSWHAGTELTSIWTPQKWMSMTYVNLRSSVDTRNGGLPHPGTLDPELISEVQKYRKTFGLPAFVEHICFESKGGPAETFWAEYQNLPGADDGKPVERVLYEDWEADDSFNYLKSAPLPPKVQLVVDELKRDLLLMTIYLLASSEHLGLVDSLRSVSSICKPCIQWQSFLFIFTYLQQVGPTVLLFLTRFGLNYLY